MIQTKNLHFSYDDSEVLSGISINIKKGSFTAILGRNGSGKSTLAKHFNALLLPSGGSVRVLGMDTKDENLLFDIRKHMGMVFQNPDNQLVAATAEDEVAFAPENLGVEPVEIRKRVDACLKTVGMSEFAKSAPSALSGGQKQRLAIASVLAMEPECIILDEPTAMLDPCGQREVISAITALNKNKGMSVVLITHNMEEAAAADRVIVTDGGKILIDGTPREVFSKTELLMSVGLDVPVSCALINELKNRGFDIPDVALSDEECADAIIRAIGGDGFDKA